MRGARKDKMPSLSFIFERFYFTAHRFDGFDGLTMWDIVV